MGGGVTDAPPISERERAVRKQLMQEFTTYARRCLRVKAKDARPMPLFLNRVQLYLHEKLEQQRIETGKVRALVLKGRQMGVSTYIGGRFYHRVSHYRGTNVYILTHEQKATDTLFSMVERFHANCPELVKPITGSSNAKELSFPGLDAGYAVGTAGTKAVGRGSTVHLLHGCLTPDTLLVSVNGRLMPMGCFSVGDWIRTHTGKPARISFISRQRKNVKTLRLKGLGDFPLSATDEHRFWTEDGWKELNDIAVGDTLGYPVQAISDEGLSWELRRPERPRPQGGGSVEHCPERLGSGYDVGRVMGLYLAEGCIFKQRIGPKEPSAICFAVHEREVPRTLAWLQPLSHCFKSAKVAARKDSKTVTVTVYGRSFAAMMRAVCGELESKSFPFGWQTGGEAFARGLIHGYFAGDGSSDDRPGNRRIRVTSVRSALTVTARDILASLGYGWAGIKFKSAALRHGRNERDAWVLSLCGAGVDRLVSELGWTMPPRQRIGRYGSTIIRDGYAWLPVTSIEDSGEQPVMDFEIDHPDHSYCTVHAATHNSEVGFWPNAESHFAGVVQAVPDLPGTEIILETTANGMGGEFHQRWQAAEKGEGDYIAIFLPWFWQDEYRRPVPDGFSPTEDEEEYKRLHDLDMEQIVWRRSKIIELKDPALFMQEYPATAVEAFQMTGHDSYIKPISLLRARKAALEAHGPLVIGYDPAWKGPDRSSMAFRRGRVVLKVQSRSKLGTMEAVGWIVNVINSDKPKRVFIDVGGLGIGIFERLEEMGYGRANGGKGIVVAVNFGSPPFEPNPLDDDGNVMGGYANRRSEMWGKSRDWLDAEGGAQIPDRDPLMADATAPGYRYDSHSRVVLESKEDIKKRKLPSPDEWDAVALTFAEPVIEEQRRPTGIKRGASVSDSRAGY